MGHCVCFNLGVHDAKSAGDDYVPVVQFRHNIDVTKLHYRNGKPANIFVNMNTPHITNNTGSNRSISALKICHAVLNIVATVGVVIILLVFGSEQTTPGKFLADAPAVVVDLLSNIPTRDTIAGLFLFGIGFVLLAGGAIGVSMVKSRIRRCEEGRTGYNQQKNYPNDAYNQRHH
jgi:hypothetical protein